MHAVFHSLQDHLKAGLPKLPDSAPGPTQLPTGLTRNTPSWPIITLTLVSPRIISACRKFLSYIYWLITVRFCNVTAELQVDHGTTVGDSTGQTHITYLSIF